MRAVAAALLAFVLGACTSSAGAQRADVGETAPLFATRDLDGNRVRLRDFRGQTVLLNFWASWCIPCRKEFPLLAQADRRESVTVLGVVYEDSDDNARRFMREHGATWPGLKDDGKIARAYRVGPGIPATIVIGPDGKVLKRILGELRNLADLDA